MMTVSVLVNQSTVQDENNAIPPKVKQKVESLVSQAVGLRAGKDLITVEFFEFIEPEALEPPAASALPWDQINEVLKNISLGVAALVALFIGLKIIKKFNPDAASSVAAAGERTTKLSELSEMVKENPEVFAKIIASWSNAEADEQDESTSKAA